MAVAHYADLDFDVTTGLRFHTLEILLSAMIKLVAVVVIGLPAVAVAAMRFSVQSSQASLLRIEVDKRI